MKHLQLVIPTHARPLRQITLQSLPAALREDVLIVTSTKSDAVQIADHYKHKNIAVAPPRIDCIAKKRHWIMQNVKAECVFMMDDDIIFFRRCDPRYRRWNDTKGQWDVTRTGITLMEQAEEHDFINAFAALEDALERGYAAVALAHRMHNNRQEESWALNTRMMYAFGVHRVTYLKLKLNFAEVLCREDFNVTLRLLRRGYQNAVYNDFMSSPQPPREGGGAGTERSLQQSDSEAIRLASLHPDFVSVVRKNYKGRGAFSSFNKENVDQRLEVQIQWKRALEEGIRNYGTCFTTE